MKILILAQPRMASKLLNINLARYLSATCESVARVIDSKSGCPVGYSLDELFNYDYDFTRSLDRCDNNLVRTSRPVASRYEEIALRRQLVSELPGAYVIKHFDNPQTVTSFLTSQVDRTYTLFRKDVFNACLSKCLSQVTTTWHPSWYQNLAIDSLKKKPAHIRSDHFTTALLRTLNYRKRHFEDTVPEYPVDFDDLCAVTDSVDFCELLKLPQVNFEFVSLAQEFGDNKTAMVSNLAELQEIFNKNKSNYALHS